MYLLPALRLFKTDIVSCYEKGKSTAKYRIGRTHCLVYPQNRDSNFLRYIDSSTPDFTPSPVQRNINND